jgi:hypothetical protein
LARGLRSQRQRRRQRARLGTRSSSSQPSARLHCRRVPTAAAISKSGYFQCFPSSGSPLRLKSTWRQKSNLPCASDTPLSKSVKLLHSRLPQDDFHATKCTWPAGRCPSPAYLLTVIFFYRIENIVSIPSFASKLYLCTSDIRMFSDGLISVETLTKQTLQRPSHFVRACQSSAIICSE